MSTRYYLAPDPLNRPILIAEFALILPFFATDVSYDYVVDQQPIGRNLFRSFCENKHPLYYRYIAFLDYVQR